MTRIKRMALVRGDYLQWSLTWHDLDVAFGGKANAPDLIYGLNVERGQTNQMRSLQEKLDSNWSTGPLARATPRIVLRTAAALSR